MGRPKKIKTIQSEENKEVTMTETLAVSEVLPDTQALESLETELDRVRIELETTRREIEEKKQELKLLDVKDLTKATSFEKPSIPIISTNSDLSEKIQSQKEFDNVPVTGKFINRRAPGQPAKLTYMKYGDDAVKWYTFEDGKVYTIKRGFADQINEYYHTPVFTQKQGPMDSTGSQIQDVDTTNKKYAFID